MHVVFIASLNILSNYQNIFKSAGVDMASVYLNLQKHVYRLLYSVYDSINTSKISFEHLLCAGHN